MMEGGREPPNLSEESPEPAPGQRGVQREFPQISTPHPSPASSMTRKGLMRAERSTRCAWCWWLETWGTGGSGAVPPARRPGFFHPTVPPGIQPSREVEPPAPRGCMRGEGVLSGRKSQAQSWGGLGVGVGKADTGKWVFALFFCCCCCFGGFFFCFFPLK